MANNNSTAQANSISRTELLWLAGAIVFGSILRLGYPGRMAIEHFDEGVYASNFWFGGEPYPAQHLYAPPLLPTAIEWTMIVASLFGIKPTGFIPIIPSLIAGIATIPSIWWIGRRSFGATAGLTSAWLVATSDFHVCYSRAALTDVPVCLFMLWAVYFMWRTLERATTAPTKAVERGKQKAMPQTPLPWSDILLAGLFTGLAWWTKYNGWLPLAIGLSGGAFWQLLTPKNERQIGRTLTCWFAVATVAFVIWSPVIWRLQDQKYGGYASVAANHRQYVVGLKGWGSSALTQMSNIGKYENPFDVFYAPFPHPEVLKGEIKSHIFLMKACAQNGLWQDAFSIFRGILFENFLPFFFAVTSLILVSWFCLRNLRRSQRQFNLLPNCLVAAWFVGLTLATPMYHPYPRLVLPWLCSIWICVGSLLQSWCSMESRFAINPRYRAKSIICVALLTSVITIRLMAGSANAWQDRSGLQTAADRFARAIRSDISKNGFSDNEAIIYVYADPAIVFGLQSANFPGAIPAQNLDFIRQPVKAPTYVAFTDLSSMPQDLQEQLMSARFERVDGYFPHRSHLVGNDSGRSAVDEAGSRLFRLMK